MATITLEIPKTIETRVIDGFCEQQGYVDTVWAANAIDRIANPESRSAFMTRVLYEYITQGIKTVESAKAMETAKQVVYADVDSKVANVLQASAEIAVKA